MGLADKLFGKHRGVYSSDTYKDTLHAVERVASSSLTLFHSKSAEEKLQITDRISTLTQKFGDIADEEQPLVVGMALLTALRVFDELLQREAGATRTARP